MLPNADGQQRRRIRRAATIDGTPADEEATLRVRLADQASIYFPTLHRQGVRVRLLSSEERQASRLYRFELRDHRTAERVVVKIPLLRGRRARHRSQRPRLTPATEVESRARLEYDALARVHRHLEALGDPRLAAVRPLDLVLDGAALVMPEVGGRPLNNLLYEPGAMRSSRRRARLMDCLASAGAWLRAYHQLPGPSASQVRHATRSGWIGAVQQLADFLGATLNDRAFFAEAADVAARAAERLLPDRLPVAPTHGDFAPRNIIVTPEDKIVVLDLLSQWRAPIYENLAYFAVDLEARLPDLLQLGMGRESRRVAAWQSQMLSGYFGGAPIPSSEIDLFCLLMLFDKWAAHAERGQGRAMHPVLRRGRRWLVDVGFRKSTLRRLRRLSGA